MKTRNKLTIVSRNYLLKKLYDRVGSYEHYQTIDQAMENWGSNLTKVNDLSNKDLMFFNDIENIETTQIMLINNELFAWEF